MFENYRKSNQSIFGVEFKIANVIKINPSLVLKFQREIDILSTCSVYFPNCLYYIGYRIFKNEFIKYIL